MNKRQWTAWLVAVCLLVGLPSLPAGANTIPTQVIDGETYFDVTGKQDYAAAVQQAFAMLAEHIPVCYMEENRDWDSRYSNDSRNFTGVQTKSIFTYAGYSPNTVCVTPDTSRLQADGTTLHTGTIDIVYSDSSEELAKADAIIDGVLAKVAGRSRREQLLYVADHICAATVYGAQELPGGGYDLINGVYELLTGVRTNIVCTSYALAFQRFMERADIPCFILSNNYHAWNIVQMEDGKWYGVDCTSDAGSTIDRGHFLMGLGTMAQYATDQLDPLTDFGRDRIAATDYGMTTTKATTTTRITTTTTTQTTTASQTEATTSSGTSVETTTTAEEQPLSVIVDVAHETPDLVTYFEDKTADVTLQGEGFSWHFAAEDMTDASLAVDFDPTVLLGEDVPEGALAQIDALADKRDYYPFRFAHHGQLPGVAVVCIRVDPAYAGQTVEVYSVNDAGEAVLETTAAVDETGDMTFTTTHCSVWFVTPQIYTIAPAGEPEWVSIAVLCGGVVALVAAGVFILLLMRKKKT